MNNMRVRRPPRRLQLGPVVGHTDDGSARIWIQVRALDDPARTRCGWKASGCLSSSAPKAVPSNSARPSRRPSACNPTSVTATE